MTRLRWSFALIVLFSFGIAVGRATAPQTGALTPSWSIAGSLAEARNYPQVTALPSGELLVTGGVDPAFAGVARATNELFDPLRGTSTLLPPAGPGRANHTATLAWGDRVVVAGGTDYYAGSWHAMDRVDVYLPDSHQWLRGASMRQPRADHAAAALRDGRVLVAGGEDGSFIYKSAELYDPATDTWTAAASMPRVRTQFLMTPLPDGRVLALGGLEERGAPSRTSVLYDPRTDSWSEGPRLRYDRVLSALATLPSGDVLVIGGQYSASNTAERYDWRLHEFRYAGVLIEPRLAAVAVALPDGSVALVGGLPDSPSRAGFAPTANAERWDPRTNTWSELPGIAAGRALGALVVSGGDAYLVGAARTGEEADPQVERLRVQ
jgi:hypothetical protein